MPIRVSRPDRSLKELFTDEAVAARGHRPAAGMFLTSADGTVAEICAGAGLDYLLLDGEHTSLSLAAIEAQLRVIAAYDMPVLVRVPWLDHVIIKQVLDLGATSILVPMVDDAEAAQRAVSAVHYPPRGVRGIGSALARSGRWNRIEGYLGAAADSISLFVQVETATAVGNAAEIAATEGVDGIFIGPSDLSASMGLIGQQSHDDVVEAVCGTISAAKDAGKIVGVNAFVEAQARRYIEAGADFVNVSADVALLARGTERLAATWCASADSQPRASY